MPYSLIDFGARLYKFCTYLLIYLKSWKVTEFNTRLSRHGKSWEKLYVLDNPEKVMENGIGADFKFEAPGQSSNGL